MLLTNKIAYSKLGTLTVTRLSARSNRSGSGWPIHPLLFLSRLGHDLSKQSIQNSQIWNCWFLCPCQPDNESSHQRAKAEPESLPRSRVTDVKIRKFSGLLSPEAMIEKWFREREYSNTGEWPGVTLVTTPYTSPGQSLSRETAPLLAFPVQSPAFAERCRQSRSGFSLKVIAWTTVLLSTEPQAPEPEMA